MARSIIHESVHAYLVALSASDPSGFASAFPFFWPDYDSIQTKFGFSGSANTAHHNEFIRSFVSSMARYLKALGQNRGYSMSDQFYEYISWGGLHNAPLYDTMSAQDKNIIQQTLDSEQTGSNSRGADAGC